MREVSPLEGSLEEFRALRVEMLQIINDRIWGQATYSVLAAGTLAFVGNSPAKVPGLVFLTGLSLPFLFHTIFREHARIRMGNYLRAVVEPQIAGMHWEAYLRAWRNKFESDGKRGWLTVPDRSRHIFALAGVYLLISSFSYALLVMQTMAPLPVALASALLLTVITTLVWFFHLYDIGADDYRHAVTFASSLTPGQQ
jgi:predicted acyltransferase